MELRPLKCNYLGLRLIAATLTTDASSASAAIGAKEFSDVTRTSAGRPDATLQDTPRSLVGASSVTVGQAADSVADGGYAAFSSSAQGIAGIKLFSAAGAGDEGTGHIVSLVRDIDDFERRSNNAAVDVACSNGEAAVVYSCRIASDGTASQPGLFKSIDVTSSVYTLTLKDAFHRAPVVLVTPIATAQKAARLTTEPTSSTIIVSTFDSSEAAEDNAFDIFIVGFMSKEEEGRKRAQIGIPRLGARLVPFAIYDDGGGTAAVYQGDEDFDVTINSTGDYSFNFKTSTDGGKRGGLVEPFVFVTGTARAQLKDTPDSDGFNIVSFNATGSAATSTNLVGFALVFDSNDGVF